MSSRGRNPRRPNLRRRSIVVSPRRIQSFACDVASRKLKRRRSGGVTRVHNGDACKLVIVAQDHGVECVDALGRGVPSFNCIRGTAGPLARILELGRPAVIACSRTPPRHTSAERKRTRESTVGPRQSCFYFEFPAPATGLSHGSQTKASGLLARGARRAARPACLGSPVAGHRARNLAGHVLMIGAAGQARSGPGRL
jgi:hypothetical protein